MNNNLFFDIISGALASDPLYSKYYVKRGSITNVEIENDFVENVDLDADIEYPYNIYLTNIKFIGTTYIRKGRFKTLKITKSNGVKEIDISGSNFERIFVTSCDIEVLTLRNGNYKSFQFYESTIGFIKIINGNFDELNFSRNKLIEGLQILGGEFKSVVFWGDQAWGEKNISRIYIQGGKYKSIHFNKSVEISTINITGGEIEDILVNSITLKELSIKGSANPIFPLVIKRIIFSEINKLSVDIVGTDIPKIKFDNCYASKDSVFRFISIMVGRIEFKNFINYGQFTFNDLSLNKGDFIIKNSDLGKTTLINCKIEQSRLRFTSSKITEIFITGTQMPGRIAGSNESKRLAYGQIKKVYENRGDVIEANLFFSREMNSYYNALSWRNDLWEKINLAFNKISTNHGRSWERGFASTLSVGLVFYWLYLYLLGFRISWHGSAETFLNLHSYFFDFINPVHKTDFVITEQKYNLAYIPKMWLARLCEGFSRIVIAYFIYQLIQAFRKHGKK